MSFVRPSFGQVWTYATAKSPSVTVRFMLIVPTTINHQWQCLVLRDHPHEMFASDPGLWIKMSGLYPDRNPLAGFTLEAT